MRLNRLPAHVTSVLVALALLCGLCAAQGKDATGFNLEIVVKDPSGAVINNAHLLLSSNGKPEATSRTNQKREARFACVANGFSPHIEAPGFKERIDPHRPSCRIKSPRSHARDRSDQSRR